MFPVSPRGKWFFPVLCLVTLFVLNGCSAQTRPFGIVVLSNNGIEDTSDIFRVPDSNLDQVEQLTFTPSIREGNLLVSAGGRQIIFEASTIQTGQNPNPADIEIEEFWHLYLLDTTSKKLEDVTEKISAQPFGKHTTIADWSSDEKQFALVTDKGNAGSMNFDGTGGKLIPRLASGEPSNIIDTIQWSPDGKSWAILRSLMGVEKRLENPGSALLLYDFASEKISQLTDYQENCNWLKWSPTSQQLVATCARLVPYSESVGADMVRIFHAGDTLDQPYEHIAFSPCREPVWSADGKQIVMICDKSAGQPGLYVVQADGNGFREVNLTNSENWAYLRSPIWSPDGKHIVCVAGTDVEHARIYVVRPDGSGLRAIITKEAAYFVVAVYPLP